MWRVGSVCVSQSIKRVKGLVTFTRAQSLHDNARINWCERGGVGLVRNQTGNTCFAFGVSDVSASAIAITGRKEVVELAPQEILDCTKWDLKGGGSVAVAFDYVSRHGIALEKFYPHTGLKENCKHWIKRNTERAFINGHCGIAMGNEQEMLRVLHYHPILGRIVFHPSLGCYRRGIYRPPKYMEKVVRMAMRGECEFGGEKIGYHFLSIVGADLYDGEPVWLVKNSWGREWGYDGFGYFPRNGPYAGALGINCWPTYPIVGPHQRYKINPRLYQYGRF